jgi:hypothetical protein
MNVDFVPHGFFDLREISAGAGLPLPYGTAMIIAIAFAVLTLFTLVIMAR